MNKISVIIPSRLQPNDNMWDDGSPTGDPTLWLDRAIFGVRHQTEFADAEIVIALDAGKELPPRFARDAGIAAVICSGTGQAAAVNRGVEAATGDVIALLEDDDVWEPGKLAAQVPLLEDYDLVTCNQREHDDAGSYVRINDFPTPSGWVMKRATWLKVGPMDETFRWHVDTEWLGRANAIPLKRIHITDTDAAVTTNAQRKDWLANVGRFSLIAHVGNDRPFVNRTVNPEGGMAKIASDPEAAKQSQEEHARMLARGGLYPW